MSDVVIEIVDHPDNEDILKRLREEAVKVITWEDIVKMFPDVSNARLRQIIAYAVSKCMLIEIKCRIFTTPETLLKLLEEGTLTLKEVILDRVLKRGVQKCGKPVTKPVQGLDVVMPHFTNKPVVHISRAVIESTLRKHLSVCANRE